MKRDKFQKIPYMTHKALLLSEHQETLDHVNTCLEGVAVSRLFDRLMPKNKSRDCISIGNFNLWFTTGLSGGGRRKSRKGVTHFLLFRKHSVSPQQQRWARSQSHLYTAWKISFSHKKLPSEKKNCLRIRKGPVLQAPPGVLAGSGCHFRHSREKGHLPSPPSQRQSCH